MRERLWITRGYLVGLFWAIVYGVQWLAGDTPSEQAKRVNAERDD